MNNYLSNLETSAEKQRFFGYNRVVIEGENYGDDENTTT